MPCPDVEDEDKGEGTRDVKPTSNTLDWSLWWRSRREWGNTPCAAPTTRRWLGGNPTTDRYDDGTM